MKNSKQKTEAAILRQKAEELLKKKSKTKTAVVHESDMLKLIHELEVHQIELELQNEELEIAKKAAEVANEKYIDLYDSALSGYITLSAACRIEMINLTGARMLGKDRNILINSNFGYFISHDTRRTFDLFFEKIFNHKTKETCQVIITTDGNMLLHVNIEGFVAGNSKLCYLTLSDITAVKLAEQLKKRTEELEQVNSYFVGRELKMIELKREINELLKKLGLDEKYEIHSMK